MWRLHWIGLELTPSQLVLLAPPSQGDALRSLCNSSVYGQQFENHQLLLSGKLIGNILECAGGTEYNLRIKKEVMFEDSAI